MIELELTIQPDGSVLVPADRPELKDLLQAFFKDIAVDPSQIDTFFQINQTELLFGDNSMCG